MGRIVYVNKNPNALVSIIIPCRKEADLIYRNKYPTECEVMAVVGAEPPGRLRDYGALFANGSYLAFMDSDAYPAQNWYDKVLAYITHVDVLCGPGVLPPGSSFRELLSDLVYRCLPYGYRVTPRKMRYVAEFPTFNLIMERRLFEAIGGFNTDMITGEDTLLCRKCGKSIFYHPKVKVYHKRRPFGKALFNQVKQYGHNRGWLIALAYPLVPMAIAAVLLVYLTFFIIGVLGVLLTDG